TPEEMSATYYPLESDYNAQVAWLTAQGFEVVKTDPCRLGVTVRGKVTQVEQALQVSFASVNANGVSHKSATSAPSLPASIATPVLGINGLQPHIQPKKHTRPTPNTSNHPPFLTSEILKAYNANGLGLTG